MDAEKVHILCEVESTYDITCRNNSGCTLNLLRVGSRVIHPPIVTTKTCKNYYLKALSLIQAGSNLRASHPTQKSPDSSRSHGICQFMLRYFKHLCSNTHLCCFVSKPRILFTRDMDIGTTHGTLRGSLLYMCHV